MLDESTAKMNKESIDSAAELPERYELEALIGQGGMGMVFKALDKILQRTVAIKLLLSQQTDAESQQRFEREAKALSLLSHPNIVRILSWGTNKKGHPFHVLEFVDGQPLSQDIGPGKILDGKSFYSVFRQVLSALSCAHEQNIVHRDIKPSNILLVKQENKLTVKLIDFGIARILAEGQKTLTSTSFLVGSPSYMSPEQCKGAKVEQASDIYSLACVMYESLMGKPPREGDSQMEIMYQHTNNDAPKLELRARDPQSKKLGRLIDQCLARDPSERPDSAQAALDQLNTIFESDEVYIQFFDEKRAKANSRIALLVLAVAGISLLGMVITLFNKSMSSSRDREYISQQKNAKFDKLAQSQAHLRERYAQSSHDKSIISKLVENLQDSAKAKMSISDYEAALAYVSEAMDLSKQHRYEEGVASSSLVKGRCLTAMHRFAEAEVAYSQGIKCNAVGDIAKYKFLAEIAKEKAKIDIHERDFVAALSDIEYMFNIGFQHDILDRRGMLAAKLSATADGALRGRELSDYLAGYIVKNPAKDNAERVLVLKLFNGLSGNENQGTFYMQETVSKNIAAYLERVQADGPEAKKALGKSYEILAKSAPINLDASQAEHYRKLSKSVAR